MKLITYIIIALIALIYCFESPIWACCKGFQEREYATFDLQEGIIVPVRTQQSFDEDEEIDEYSIYPQAEDIG